MSDYSVRAILSATDKGFSSTLNKAASTLNNIPKAAQNAGAGITSGLSSASGSANKLSSSMQNVGNSTASNLSKASNSANGFSRTMQNVGVAAGSGLQKMGSTLNDTGNKIQEFGNNAQQHLTGVGHGMQIAGAATTAMGIAGVKSFGDFETSLNKAAVVAGGTAKDINGLAEVANHMGAVLPLSAKESADAMVEMARNGASVG